MFSAEKNIKFITFICSGCYAKNIHRRITMCKNFSSFLNVFGCGYLIGFNEINASKLTEINFYDVQNETHKGLVFTSFNIDSFFF